MERGAERQHLAVGLDQLGEGRTSAVGLVHRMVGDDPLGSPPDRDDARLGLAAAHRPRPGPDALRQPAIGVDRLGGARVERRQVCFVGRLLASGQRAMPYGSSSQPA